MLKSYCGILAWWHQELTAYLSFNHTNVSLYTRKSVSNVHVITRLNKTAAECWKFSAGSWNYLLHHRWVILPDEAHYLTVWIHRHWNRSTKWRQVEERGISQSQNAFKGFPYAASEQIMNYPWLQNRSALHGLLVCKIMRMIPRNMYACVVGLDSVCFLRDKLTQGSCSLWQSNVTSSLVKWKQFASFL